MPPLILLMLVMTAGWQVLLRTQFDRNLADMVEDQVQEIVSDMSLIIGQQSAGLALAIQPIISDAATREALRAGDAESLLAAWSSPFAAMQRENKLTHFYFFDASRVCLLRIHDPGKSGDLIERFTASEAELTGRAASGIEIGPLGTFTLRLVQPVFEGNALLGYVELGKEIEDVMQSLDTIEYREFSILIRKEYLNREAWESGMRMLGREADWDRLSDSVVIYSSNGRLPDEVAAWVQDPVKARASKRKNKGIAIDGVNWMLREIPLPDVSKRVVGSLLVMNDFSIQERSIRRLLSASGALGLGLMGVLLVFIYVLLKSTDASIAAQQRELLVSRGMLGTYLNVAAEIILSMDVHGTILLLNDSGHRLLGYESGELAGRNWFEVCVPEADRDIVRDAVNVRFLGGDASVAHFENAVLTKSGMEKDILWHNTLIKNRYGQVSGVLSSGEDITERKKAAQALVETNRRLEETTVRAEEMAKQAELANIAKSEFLANMSHAASITTRYTADDVHRRLAGRGARILIAEDNITNQQVALGILKKLGLSAEAVADGAEAVKALESIPYDLVLMDVQMPVMDGLEATRRIRDPRSAVLEHAIPVIAMTAYAIQGDKERCVAAGMDDYVSKPVSPTELVSVLERWLPGDSRKKVAGTTSTGIPAKPTVGDAPASAEDGLPVFDKAGFLSRLMDDAELMKVIIVAFMEDIPPKIEALAHALETGDHVAAGRLSHSVKGASANVGGERVRAMATAIEVELKRGKVGEAQKHMALLVMEFDRLKEAMAEAST